MTSKSTSCLVRVPASTANLGPGFDCLGIALRIYNTVRVDRNGPKPTGMIAETANAFFKTAKIAPFPFSASITGDVPAAGGLGSSVTVRLGVAAGLNALAGAPLSPEKLLGLIIDLEGHPDNAVAAARGGFVACAGTRYFRTTVSPRLHFVGFIPAFGLETKKARAILPKSLPMADAVANLGHAALITAAFARRDYEALPDLFADRWHQPYRAPLIPCWDGVQQAALRAGALGFFLSGAGPTLLSVALKNPEKIARAMALAAKKAGVAGRTFITQADNQGLRYRLVR